MSSGHTLTTETITERVQVIVAGETLADSTSAVVLYETGLPPRHYFPREHVRFDLLVPTTTASHCPFKGDAVYWSARLPDGEVVDVAWSYPTPIPERADITGLVCFFHERVDEIRVDDVRLEAPDTPWSTPTAS